MYSALAGSSGVVSFTLSMGHSGPETPLGTPLLSLSSGYVERAAVRLPKQGDKDPWRIHHNVFKDRKILGRARFNDGALRFSKLD